MRKYHLLISILLLLISIQSFAQKTGPKVEHSYCLYQYNLLQKGEFEKAREYSDKCITLPENIEIIQNYRPWYYRGKIYQKIYEDSILEINIPKDSVLICCIESFLKAYCLNIVSDTIAFEKLKTDSSYIEQSLGFSQTHEFENNSHANDMSDSILPKISEYLKLDINIQHDNKNRYLEIIRVIVKNP